MCCLAELTPLSLFFLARSTMTWLERKTVIHRSVIHSSRGSFGRLMETANKAQIVAVAGSWWCVRRTDRRRAGTGPEPDRVRVRHSQTQEESLTPVTIWRLSLIRELGGGGQTERRRGRGSEGGMGGGGMDGGGFVGSPVA